MLRNGFWDVLPSIEVVWSHSLLLAHSQRCYLYMFWWPCWQAKWSYAMPNLVSTWAWDCLWNNMPPKCTQPYTNADELLILRGSRFWGYVRSVLPLSFLALQWTWEWNYLDGLQKSQKPFHNVLDKATLISMFTCPFKKSLPIVWCWGLNLIFC